jgi:hypothetical protein
MQTEFTGAGAKRSWPRIQRMARTRHYLMCSPTFFDVTYSINPWMEPGKPVDADLAVAQWWRLYELYLSLGHGGLCKTRR